MNPILLVFLIGLIGALTALAIKLRNDKFAGSEAGANAEQEAKAYAEQVLCAGETLLLYDYSMSMKAIVVVSDKKIYYKQHGRREDKHFETAYAEIEKCIYTDAAANKVKSDGNVMNIEIRTTHGKCTLYQFPKAKIIAEMLADRGFEKKGLF